MLDLSPTKLLIIFVVVVVLLGPKRLPGVARQLGAAWGKLRQLHQQVDRELRQTVPDLPSSQDIVRFARSPVTLLNQLADRSDASAGAALDGAGQVTSAGEGSTGRGAQLDGANHDNRTPVGRALARLDVDDPNLN